MELEKLRQENDALRAENLTLKNNHAELLSKYDDILERLIKLENGAAVNPVTKPDDPKPAEISDLKCETLNISDSIRELQNGWSKAQGIIDIHAKRLDDHDQNSRKNSLIINKLDDIPSKTYGLEFSKYVIRKLKELLPSIADKISVEDIDVSHPLPPTKVKKSTRVICKFVRRDIKNLVFYAKRDLKGSPLKITIAEHLSSFNLWLLEQVRTLVPFRNTWTSQCVVFALVNGRKVAIKSQRDLNYVYNITNNVQRISPAQSHVSNSNSNDGDNITISSQHERDSAVNAAKEITNGSSTSSPRDH